MDAFIHKQIIANKCFGQSELEYFWLFSSRKTQVHPENTYHNFKATLPKMLEQKETCDVELKSVFTNWRVGANVIDEDTTLHWRLNGIDVLLHECWDMYFMPDGSKFGPDFDGSTWPSGAHQANFCIPVRGFADESILPKPLYNSCRSLEGEAYFVKGTEIQNQFDSFNHLAASIRSALSDIVIKDLIWPYVTEPDGGSLIPETYVQAKLHLRLWCQSMFTRQFCDGFRDMVTKIHWQPNGTYGLNGFFTYGFCAANRSYPNCGFLEANIPPPGDYNFDTSLPEGEEMWYNFVKTRLFWLEFDFISKDAHWNLPFYTGTEEPSNYLIEVDRKKLILARLMGFPPAFIMSYAAHEFLTEDRNIGTPRWTCAVKEPILKDFMNSYIGFAYNKAHTWQAGWKTRDPNWNFVVADVSNIAYPTYNKTSLETSAVAIFKPCADTFSTIGGYFYKVTPKATKHPFVNIPIQPFISITQYPDGVLSDLFAKTHYILPYHWVKDPLFYSYDHIRYNSVFIIPFLTPDFYMDDDIIFMRCITPHATLNYTNEAWTDVVAMIPVYNVSVDSSFVVFNTFLETWTLAVLAAIPYPEKEPMYEGVVVQNKINTWNPLHPDIYPRYKTTPPPEEGAEDYFSYKEVNIVFAGGNIYVNQIGNYQPFKFLNEFQERTSFKLMPEGEPITTFEIAITNKYNRPPNVVVFGNKSPETYMNMFLQYADTSYKKSSFRSFAGTRMPFTRNR